MSFLHIAAILALISSPVWSYSSGAPPSGCDILGPKHRGEDGQALRSQNDPAPYKFILAQNTAQASQPLEIQLIATGPVDIQGFMVQAHVDGKPAGSFSATPSAGNAQTLQCSQPDDSLTHTKIKDTKVKSVNFLWTPSANLKGKSVKLIGTVAASYDKFWIKGVSANIQVA